MIISIPKFIFPMLAKRKNTLNQSAFRSVNEYLWPKSSSKFWLVCIWLGSRSCQQNTVSNCDTLTHPVVSELCFTLTFFMEIWLGEKMTNSIFVIVLFSSLIIACAKPDKSILVKNGDDLLDCRALKKELDFAKNLGENAPSRRRHIRALQEKRQCIKSPEISISIGVIKSL